MNDRIIWYQLTTQCLSHIRCCMGRIRGPCGPSPYRVRRTAGPHHIMTNGITHSRPAEPRFHPRFMATAARQRVVIVTQASVQRCGANRFRHIRELLLAVSRNYLTIDREYFNKTFLLTPAYMVARKPVPIGFWNRQGARMSVN